jgi:hypothetical protein
MKRRQDNRDRHDRWKEKVERLVAEADVPEPERVAYAGFCTQLHAEGRRAGPLAARQVDASVERLWLGRGLDLRKLRALAGLVLSAAARRGMEV